jgi:3-oxoacyl-[acyl-carrier-protein] synthase II
MDTRRVVITGMGVVAPNGVGVEKFWDSLIHGRSAVRTITRFDASSFPSQIAAEVSDFDPTDYMDAKTAKMLARFAQFGLAASQMAIEDSEIDFNRENSFRTGVYFGTAIGGGDVIETQHAIFLEKGLKRMRPYLPDSISAHSASAIIACEFKLKGPNTTVSAGCNSGLDAAYLASNAIRLGDADVMIVGVGEAPITPFCYALFCATGNLSRENQEPKRALKPYDMNADGMVLGEGGAAIVLEELQHALKRQVRIYGEVVSHSASNEAFDIIAIDPDIATMVLSFEQVLKRGNIDIKEIDHISAHGNGILPYDINETQAIKKVFGELAYNIPVTSIKPVTGHSISVTGIFQIIASLLAMQQSLVPPTINVQNPAPECDLNYVTDGYIKTKVRTVLVNAHGFGGRITMIALRNSWDGTSI